MKRTLSVKLTLIVFTMTFVTIYAPCAFSGSTWTPMNGGTATDFNGVWGSSGSDVFAVGPGVSNGAIFHYNGNSWSEELAPPTEGSALYGIWGSSGSDVFVVGNTNTLHYDGSAWTPMTNGPSNGMRVWGSSGTDVFVVGAFAPVYHYDGSTWTSTTVGNNVWCVWGSSGTDVFAGGWNGYITHYNGSTWNPMNSGTTNTLNGIWGSTGTDVFAVGDIGTIIHYNGSTWSSMASGTTNGLYGVWGSSGNDVFAVGDAGTILHYDGSAWSSMASGTTHRLYGGVWGSSGNDVFAVGEGGTILHYGETPTVISLSSFTATPDNKEVIIRWSTEAEIDNAGINLYRSKSENGEYVKINESLIPAKGSTTQGASYEFVDTDVQNRKTYYYKLEDIDLSGKSTMHGPVKATPRWICGVGKQQFK